MVPLNGDTAVTEPNSMSALRHPFRYYPFENCLHVDDMDMDSDMTLHIQDKDVTRFRFGRTWVKNLNE